MGDFSVYILHSERLNKFYIGTTDDVQRRLEEHNSSAYKDSFTTKGRPWILFLAIEGLSSEQAYKIEKKIKSQKSSKYLLNLKQYPEIIEKLRNL